MFTTNEFFFFSYLSPTVYPRFDTSESYPPQDVIVYMTSPLESKKRRDRGWLSFKTCCSEAEAQDVLSRRMFFDEEILVRNDSDFPHVTHTV